MINISAAPAQVYDGSKAGWHEYDPCDPVNAYGQTKHEAELLIQVRSNRQHKTEHLSCCLTS